MSLPRVASLETFMSILPEGERSRRSSISSSLAAPPVGAFEVPEWKRVLQIAVTVFYCLLSAGVVFGYAALKPVLKQEGAYQDVCDGEDTCVEIHLNLMFTVAAVATNVAALPVGAILDHFGPRVCGVLGALFLTVGSFFMAFAKRMPIDGFLLGYLFLALGGPFTYISSFQLSNAFPKRSGLILALLTGAFDASSALFLVYRLIFQSTGGSFGHQKFFLAYLAVPLIIVIFQFTVLPKQSYKTVGEMIHDIGAPVSSDSSMSSNVIDPEDQVDEHSALLREERREERREQRANLVHDIEELLGSDSADKKARREESKNENSGVWGVMHANTALEQIRSPWFVLICLFTVVQMTRINYFVATIRPQYEAIFHSKSKAIEINNFFDLALPVGGIISIPFIGTILDHTRTLTVLATLVSVATTIGILGILPYTWAAYANICLFVLYRPFYYTAVSDYSAKVFGFRTFGTVYGTIICLSGLLNFSQSGLDYLFHETFRGDPAPVNIILMSIGLVVGICLVGYVGIKARMLRIKREAGYANWVGEY